MDITKFNFHEQLDSVLEAIQNCSFMAIDTEFTGLNAYDGCHAAPFDTPEERYNKLSWGSTDFLIIQFGLCTFHFDKEKKRYEAQPYNFYVFPRPQDKHAPDRRFLCQSSSIEFLISQGFDFNKVFKEGIPYLRPEVSSVLQADMSRRHQEATKVQSAGFTSPTQKQPMDVPEEQKPFLNTIVDSITNYLETDEKEPLGLPPCNAFQRRLIYQTVEEKFPSVQLETVTGEQKQRYMLVSRQATSPEEKLKKQQARQALERMELDTQIGFTKVIQAISESGKLVVGHNMFLDVIHSVNQFNCSLPDSLEDFKGLVKAVFPRLLDTKLLANTHPFKEYILHSSLDEVRMTTQQAPFKPVTIDLSEGFDKYSDGAGALHEAGYDALVTGSCFAHMVKYLGSYQDPVDEFLSPVSPAIEPFVNKLFMMRINDIPYLNLNGPDMTAVRDHVFHVTFPREWKPTDLYTLFNPYGPSQISWLTETTAYVAMHRKENAGKALKALSKDKGLFQVVSYASHQQSKVFSSTPTYKKTQLDHRKPSNTPTSQPTVNADNKRKHNTEDSKGPPNKSSRLSGSTEPTASLKKTDLKNTIKSSKKPSKSNEWRGQSVEDSNDSDHEQTKDKLFEETDW